MISGRVPRMIAMVIVDFCLWLLVENWELWNSNHKEYKAFYNNNIGLVKENAYYRSLKNLLSKP